MFRIVDIWVLFDVKHAQIIQNIFHVRQEDIHLFRKECRNFHIQVAISGDGEDDNHTVTVVTTAAMTLMKKT